MEDDDIVSEQGPPNGGKRKEVMAVFLQCYIIHSPYL